jgi:hypothetical protein
MIGRSKRNICERALAAIHRDCSLPDHGVCVHEPHAHGGRGLIVHRAEH